MHLLASREYPVIDYQTLAEFTGRERLFRAVNGAFQTTLLPQTSASAAFHDQTATGKLKAEMMPVTPSGCQVSDTRCS
jgi:hypothetical protein